MDAAAQGSGLSGPGGLGPGEQLLTPARVAWVLNISERTLRDWQRRRVIPFVKVGSQVVRYRAEDVAAFLASHRRASKSRNSSLRQEQGMLTGLLAGSEESMFWARMRRLIEAVVEAKAV